MITKQPESNPKEDLALANQSVDKKNEPPKLLSSLPYHYSECDRYCFPFCNSNRSIDCDGPVHWIPTGTLGISSTSSIRRSDRRTGSAI